jgi:hypothetical protein
MPRSTVLAIPPEEQAQLLGALRRARYGYLLGLHIVLLCAVGCTPTDIATALLCSRSSVYRTVRAYCKGTLGWEHDEIGQLGRACAHHGIAPHTAVVAGSPAQREPSGLRVVPDTLDWCDIGPDAADQTGGHGLGRDGAALAP